MAERNLVVFPIFSVQGTAISVRSLNTVDPLIRRSVLYWDRIDLPDTNLISLGSTKEIAEYEAEGVLTRTRFRALGSGNLESLYVNTLFATFAHLSKTSPGVWSLAQQGSSLYLPPEMTAEARTLQVELYNLLPAPADDVSVTKIVKFREARRAELVALRAALDEIYQSIVNSADLPHARTSAHARLQQTVADLWKSMNESFPARLLPSVKVELSASKIVAGAGLGVAAAGQLGIPLSIGGAAGAVVSALKLDIGLGKVPREPGVATDFAYIHSVMKELL